MEVRGGDVVDGILRAATEMQADVIGMATAGHHVLLDALRGSTIAGGRLPGSGDPNRLNYLRR